ncbi:putative TMEM220 protein [Medicago truncatula]|uniref:Putative TMEM220 protein n=1 Tax=Medicago truncatula TaxID=3880 RepID=A0A396GNT7_MEDTR|nr:uncharacterized protein LOC25501648 [Medicago truncatula]XP_024627611.1 uncharacterized protein LOC25501648 [Medicago truncatula]XP_024627613.1 uncharacterized protein LOC25501648 [Medicago truncatula]XP_024627614.1 uncharacterized protein LOC25501648 [Medicago truncatula]RHN42163.1 putative TMEM220 protein [Medicago truncatula]
MATSSSRLFNLCSLLMSTLFAYSASVQLNDPDWYFWFPLYSCACLINLNSCIMKIKLNKPIATITIWIGILLCSKVVVEDYVYEIAGFWSLDLSERVVREKVGSIFVIISIFFQMEAASDVQKDISNVVKYGMLVLVVFSYLLPFVFFVVLKGEMKL